MNNKLRGGFYKDALALMIPLILQNFVTNLMQLADSFMVGAVGETELAAVTSANTVFFVVALACFGIQSGTSVLVSQYYGRNSMSAINRVMGMGIYASLGLTALVAVLAFCFPMDMMRVLTNNSALWGPGAEYSRIVGFSYIFMSLSGAYVAVQRSMENPQLGARLFSVSGALNILLNYVLIFGKWGAPALGCAGAALATLISRAFEVLVIIVYALRPNRLPLFPSLILRPGRVMAKDFFRYSLPVVLNEGLWSAGIALYTVILGHMPNSTPLLAAYTVAGSLDRMLSVGLFAAGSATAVIIGRDIVRSGRDSIRAEGKALNIMCFLIGCASLVLLLIVRYFLCDDFIFPVLNISDSARGTAKYMLLVTALMMPMRGITLCNIVGVFRSGGDVKYALICDILPLYALAVPLSAVAALVLGADIRVVYLCMYVDELIKVFLIAPRLKSGKWINNVTRDELIEDE